MNAEDLLLAIEQADDAYVLEAGAARRRSAKRSAERTKESSADEGRPVLLREGRPRMLWGSIAAALALILAAGSVLLLLRSNRSGGEGPKQAASPSTVRSASDSTEPSEGPDEAERPQRLNALQLEPETLLADVDPEEAAGLRDWLRAREASEKNEMTGLFAGKNLIIVAAHAFAPQLIDPERTPTLYRLATRGVRFSDYYQPAWGSADFGGEFAILTGLAPTDIQAMPRSSGKNMGQTVGNLLRAQGYYSRAWSDVFSYVYGGRNKSHVNLGYEQFIGVGNGLEQGLTRQWPYSDREMLDFTLPELLEHQPFSAYYLTGSAAGAFHTEVNAMARKHRGELEDLPCSDTVKNYYAANMEVELALRDLVEALERAGIADNTVIVLSSTEYPYALEQDADYGNTEDYLGELYGKPVENRFERDRSVLILWSGCLEGRELRVDAPVSSLDILPTLCNLFGLEYDSRLLAGRDVFSKQEPLVLWNDGSWLTDRGRYDAAARVCTMDDGSEPRDDYAARIQQETEVRLRWSAAVLEYDLFAGLWPRSAPQSDAAENDDGWRYTPAADPVETVREALTRQTEKDYTISLRVDELRPDETERQQLLARDLDCALARRNGFGATGEALAALPAEQVAVVYARYTAEYDHSKIFYRDGALDQYFYLVRNGDGNWEIFAASYTGELTPD